MEAKKVLIVDGTNHFIRTWAVDPTMGVNGEHLGGVVGFIRSLKALMRNTRPTLVIVVWDGPGGSAKRRSVYSEYKAGRKPHTNRQYDFETVEESYENMQFQKDLIKRYLRCLGIQQLEIPDIEADDVIGFLCRHVYSENEKVILSSDKDFYQLVDQKTIIWSPSKKKLYGPKELVDEYKVLPENFILLKALKGDGSDNVRGVGGIADKTAVKLFPILCERPISCKELLDYAEFRKGESPKYRSVLEKRDLVMGNVDLMQLTTPIISPQSALIIRNVERQESNFSMSEFKFSLIRDGIQFTDHDLVQVFQEYWMRRRRNEAQ